MSYIIFQILDQQLQTATPAQARAIVKQAEKDLQKIKDKYCTLDHTPNAEAIKAINEPRKNAIKFNNAQEAINFINEL